MPKVGEDERHKGPKEETKRTDSRFSRRVDHSPRSYPRSQDLLRYNPRGHPGGLVDTDQHHVHDGLLHHVPLGPRGPV